MRVETELTEFWYNEKKERGFIRIKSDANYMPCWSAVGRLEDVAMVAMVYLIDLRVSLGALNEKVRDEMTRAEDVEEGT